MRATVASQMSINDIAWCDQQACQRIRAARPSSSVSEDTCDEIMNTEKKEKKPQIFLP